MTLFDLMAKITLDTSDYDKGLDESEGKVTSFAQKIKGGLATAGKVGAIAIGAVTTASVAAAGAITQNAGKVAEYGDNIDKMSQKMGISAQAYQEWDAIMQHSGTSIDALKPSMKTLANAAEKNSDAFQKLGISQDEVASLNQEQLFARTISALQSMEEGTERTYLTSKLLGRGATELGALLNTSAEDTEKMRQRVHELGGVMSDEAVKAAAKYQDSLQDMNTSIDGIRRNVFSSFLPSLTAAMDGLTNLFAGDTEPGVEQISTGVSQAIENVNKIMPRVFEIGGGIAQGLARAFGENFPAIVSAGAQAISQLLTGIVEHIPEAIAMGGDIVKSIISGFAESAPTLMQAGVDAIKTISDGLADGIPTLLENALPMLVQFSASLRENAGTLVDAGLNLLKNLAQGIADGLPALIENLPEIVTNIANIINDNAPKILFAGLQIIATLARGIIEAIPVLIANIPKIAEAIFAVWSAINWVQLGTNLVRFIGDGIRKFAAAIPNTLKNIGEAAIRFFMGINWPQAGASVIQFLSTSILQLASMVPNALLSIGKMAVNAFLSINWANIGINVIRGIAKGITSYYSILINAAINAVKGAFNAVKRFLGIRSPSKLFRDQIGKMMALGLGQGFENNIPVSDMVDSLGGAVDELEDFDAPTFAPDMMDTTRSVQSFYVPDKMPTLANSSGMGYNDSNEIFTVPRVQNEYAGRDLNVFFQFERGQMAKLVYTLNNEETQRVGVKLAGGAI